MIKSMAPLKGFNSFNVHLTPTVLGNLWRCSKLRVFQRNCTLLGRRAKLTQQHLLLSDVTMM